MEQIVVRQAGLGDLSEVAEMCHCLWPDADAAEHEQDLTPLLGGQSLGAFPAIVLLAQDTKGRIVGFIEVGLRSHADGCNPSRPVALLRDGTLRLPTGAEKSARDSLAQLKLGLEIKVARRWLPTRGWKHSTLNVLTKRSGLRLWTVVYTIENSCNPVLSPGNRQCYRDSESELGLDLSDPLSAEISITRV
jgi:hypothetical protein